MIPPIWYGSLSIRMLRWRSSGTGYSMSMPRKECGILTDFSWWSYRIPGHGLLDWRKLTGELEKAGYQGTVSIEHEDPDYEDSLDLVENGLILGKEYLKAFIGKR